MKSILIFATLCLCNTILLRAQKKLVINTVNQSRETPIGTNKNSGADTLIIVLKDTGFDKIQIDINKLQLAFNCTANNCINLFSTDIENGRISLLFFKKKLIAIGKRPLLNPADLLTGKDTIRIKGLGKDPVIMDILPFVTEGTKESTVTSSQSTTTSPAFDMCTDAEENKESINRQPDVNFLCGAQIKNSDCSKCGIPIDDENNDLYLTPCIDKWGNAVSVKNHMLYNMSQKLPLKKLMLFKVKRSGKYEKTCADRPFQYEKRKMRMSPKVGDVMAVSVIAPKDSLIIIDSNYVNFFLDSADATQKAWTEAGSKNLPPVPDPYNNIKATNSTLREAVALKEDLATFNNAYKDGEFEQAAYDKMLACMQQIIVDTFKLSRVPTSGQELAIALDKLMAGFTDSQYAYFACKLLQQIKAEYDSALNRTSKYRMYTRLLQVPNADEFSVGIRYGKDSATLYRHKFLVQGGIKIDFGTGVFITGLNDREFILKSLRFNIQDSLTGTVRDTTGNMIQANKKKLNFSTGLLVHVYRRSGRYINYGMVTGITYTNEDFMWVLGGSLMFRMGNARLSLMGGMAIGREKTLDANHEQYEYNAEVYPTTGRIYLKDQLPRFFSETNVSTYDKRHVSWFVGVSYNFASIKL